MHIHTHTPALANTLEYTLCSYLWLQGVQPHRCGIRSPCRQSRRPSSRSRRSPGRLKTGARLAAERLPWRPAGTPGRGRVTCLGRHESECAAGIKLLCGGFELRCSSQANHQREEDATCLALKARPLSLHLLVQRGRTDFLILQ